MCIRDRARHYLSPTDAGNYSALSVLGRIAFYAPLGVGVAMFPKTSESFERNGDHRRLFLKALVITLVIASCVVLPYGLCPQLIVDVIFGTKYSLVAPFVFRYGAVMGLFALSFVVARYLLSTNKTIIVYPLAGVTLFQVVLISMFHSTIGQWVSVMLVSGGLSVACLLPFCLVKVRRLPDVTDNSL